MKEYQFDPVAKRDQLIDNLKKYAKSSGFDKVIIGISGGKDSTVSAALCARAFGPDHVYGVMLPDGKQIDIADSKLVCESLGINTKEVNIGEIHQSLLRAVHEESAGFDSPADRESDINVGPRLRMTVLRYIGQALGARLVGTGNLSEATVGYCTKDGDTSCDFSLMGSMTSVEVVQVGLTMDEIPRHLVEKPPTDGLSGKTDEERLGVTYQQIHDFIRLGTSGDEAVDALIAKKKENSRHKREPAVVIR